MIEAFQGPALSTIDVIRRAQGLGLEALGFGPHETPFRIRTRRDFWQLRSYQQDSGNPTILIVAAPIKRPYIWDLAPRVSALRYLLQRGARVYLLEWTFQEKKAHSNIGVGECITVIAECNAMINESDGVRPFLAGHSLGGTLGAIFCNYNALAVSGLLLLSAPLCFRPGASSFGDALARLAPAMKPEMDMIPGSALTCASVLAAPRTFIWARLIDSVQSLWDARALEVLLRVERWALDEAPLPSKLAHEVLHWFYREDRFSKGLLPIRSSKTGPASLQTPTLAVVNRSDDVAPLAAIEPLLKARRNVRIIEYPGETGVAMQHLAVLIGRRAHAEIWPEVASWLFTQKHPQCN